MTDLELADAVLDALTQDYAGLDSAQALWEPREDAEGETWPEVPEPTTEARVRLEALFRDLRARGEL